MGVDSGLVIPDVRMSPCLSLSVHQDSDQSAGPVTLCSVKQFRVLFIKSYRSKTLALRFVRFVATEHDLGDGSLVQL